MSLFDPATLGLDSAVARIGVALGIGLLVGLERERRKGEGPTRGAAGLRTFAVASLAGAIGFIVVQDAWYSFRFREHMLTFTSKVILASTAFIFLAVTASLFFLEPSIRHLPSPTASSPPPSRP